MISTSNNPYTFYIPLDSNVMNQVTYKSESSFDQVAEIKDDFLFIENLHVRLIDTSNNKLFLSDTDFEFVVEIK